MQHRLYIIVERYCSASASFTQGGPESKLLHNHQKIVLKPANEIWFFVKLQCQSRTTMSSLGLK